MIRMRKDIDYFNSKMGKIEGSGDLGTRLLELVNAKTTSSDAKPAETPQSKEQDGEAKPEQGP